MGAAASSLPAAGEDDAAERRALAAYDAEIAAGRAEVGDARDGLLWLCAARHPRLGRTSPARGLPDELLRIIGAFASPRVSRVADLARALTQRAGCRARRGDFDLARRDAAEAAALAPTYAKPHYIAGAALLALRRPAEAASALRRALRHDDDDGRCAREIDATLLDGLVLCLDTYPARTPPAPARRLVDARA